MRGGVSTWQMSKNRHIFWKPHQRWPISSFLHCITKNRPTNLHGTYKFLLHGFSQWFNYGALISVGSLSFMPFLVNCLLPSIKKISCVTGHQQGGKKNCCISWSRPCSGWLVSWTCGAFAKSDYCSAWYCCAWFCPVFAKWEPFDDQRAVAGRDLYDSWGSCFWRGKMLRVSSSFEFVCAVGVMYLLRANIF